MDNKYLKILDSDTQSTIMDFEASGINVTPDTLPKGVIAHDKTGKQIIGTGPRERSRAPYIDKDGYFVCPASNVRDYGDRISYNFDNIFFTTAKEIPENFLRYDNYFLETTVYGVYDLHLDTIEKIGRYAFMGLPLSSIYIPNCKFIGRYAFRACMGLSAVYLNNNYVTELEDANAFQGCSSDLSFYVNEEMISKYMAAPNWSTYSSQFVAYIP